jgi:hypothetical protein
MRDWQLYTLVIGGALFVGYLFAKAGVAYVSKGAPIPAAVGTDPTVNFTDGATTVGT